MLAPLPTLSRVTARHLLFAFAAGSVALAVVTDQTPHRIWGLIAAGGYLLIALAGWAERGRGPWLAGLAGIGLPLAFLVAARTTAQPGGAPDRYAQIEVRLVETAARRWLETGSPYPSVAETAALTASGNGVDGYLPYLPGMAVFGLPRALLGGFWLTDARVVFVLVAGAGLALAVRLLRDRRPGRTAVWLAIGNPVVGITAATGGHDLPMAGLLVAALAAARRHPGAAGLLAGFAASTKPMAWPVLLVLLVFVVRTAGRRAGACAALAAVLPVLACVPALLRAGPAVAFDQLVLFPAGLASVLTPAGSPLPGGWLAALPSGRGVALALLVAAALLVGARLVRRPPPDIGAAARLAGCAMATAIMLAPSSRVGWTVLPLLLWALAAEAGALTRRRARTERVSVDACDPPSPSRPSSSPTSSGVPS